MALEPSAEHVEVTRRTGNFAQPVELGTELVGGIGVEHAREGAEVGAEPARRDPEEVHRLGIVSQSNAAGRS